MRTDPMRVPAGDLTATSSLAGATAFHPDHVTAPGYRRVNTSSANRAARAVWAIAYWLLVRPTPRPLHAWRAFVLRLFGAKLGRSCHVYPGARIWAPWHLVVGDHAAIADGAQIYNPATVTLGAHSIISQDAYLCGASHDYNDPAFPMVWAPIRVGRYAWVGARAAVLMGVTLGEGAVLGLGAIATGDLAPWGIYVGVPARRVGDRRPMPAG
jgi:putative colanic acid biosynthesis acetyltransferase WcaF